MGKGWMGGAKALARRLSLKSVGSDEYPESGSPRTVASPLSAISKSPSVACRSPKSSQLPKSRGSILLDSSSNPEESGSPRSALASPTMSAQRRGLESPPAEGCVSPLSATSDAICESPPHIRTRAGIGRTGLRRIGSEQSVESIGSSHGSDGGRISGRPADVNRSDSFESFIDFDEEPEMHEEVLRCHVPFVVYRLEQGAYRFSHSGTKKVAVLRAPRSLISHDGAATLQQTFIKSCARRVFVVFVNGEFAVKYSIRDRKLRNFKVKQSFQFVGSGFEEEKPEGSNPGSKQETEEAASTSSQEVTAAKGSCSSPNSPREETGDKEISAPRTQRTPWLEELGEMEPAKGLGEHSIDFHSWLVSYEKLSGETLACYCSLDTIASHTICMPPAVGWDRDDQIKDLLSLLDHELKRCAAFNKFLMMQAGVITREFSLPMEEWIPVEPVGGFHGDDSSSEDEDITSKADNSPSQLRISPPPEGKLRSSLRPVQKGIALSPEPVHGGKELEVRRHIVAAPSSPLVQSKTVSSRRKEPNLPPDSPVHAAPTPPGAPVQLSSQPQNPTPSGQILPHVVHQHSEPVLLRSHQLPVQDLPASDSQPQHHDPSGLPDVPHFAHQQSEPLLRHNHQPMQDLPTPDYGVGSAYTAGEEVPTSSLEQMSSVQGDVTVAMQSEAAQAVVIEVESASVDEHWNAKYSEDAAPHKFLGSDCHECQNHSLEIRKAKESCPHAEKFLLVLAGNSVASVDRVSSPPPLDILQNIEPTRNPSRGPGSTSAGTETSAPDSPTSMSHSGSPSGPLPNLVHQNSAPACMFAHEVKPNNVVSKDLTSDMHVLPAKPALYKKKSIEDLAHEINDLLSG